MYRCIYVCMSIHLSICVNVSVNIYIHLNLSISIYLSVYMYTSYHLLLCFHLRRRLTLTPCSQMAGMRLHLEAADGAGYVSTLKYRYAAYLCT